MSSFSGCRSLVAARGPAQTRPRTRRRARRTSSPAEALSARRQAAAPCRRRSRASAHGPPGPLWRPAGFPGRGICGSSSRRSIDVEDAGCNFRCERRECPRPGGRREGRSTRSSRPTLRSETGPGGPPREGTRGDPPSPSLPPAFRTTHALANRIRESTVYSARSREHGLHGEVAQHDEPQTLGVHAGRATPPAGQGRAEPPLPPRVERRSASAGSRGPGA
jgi:hypothetical protein